MSNRVSSKQRKYERDEKLRVDHAFFDEFYHNIILNAKSAEENLVFSEPEELWTSGSDTEGVESDMTSSCYDSAALSSAGSEESSTSTGDEADFLLSETVDADRVAVKRFLRACRPTMVQPQLKNRTSGGYDVRSLDLVPNIVSDKTSDVHMHVVCSNKNVTTNLVTPRGRVVSRRRLLNRNPIRRNSGKKKKSSRQKGRMPKLSEKGIVYSASSDTWDSDDEETSSRSLYAFASSCSCSALP